jgi:hypothetical protein
LYVEHKDLQALKIKNTNRIVRGYVSANELRRVEVLIDYLTGEFTFALLPNARNGGLIALAAVTIALGPTVCFLFFFG